MSLLLKNQSYPQLKSNICIEIKYKQPKLTLNQEVAGQNHEIPQVM